MSAPQTLDYNAYVYIAVTLNPNSIYLEQPISLPDFPSVSHLGNVGQMQDVQLISVPKDEWQNIGERILSSLNGKDEVARADVQVVNSRRKRGDEL